jgi:hypothetical protein
VNEFDDLSIKVTEVFSGHEIKPRESSAYQVKILVRPASGVFRSRVINTWMIGLKK